MSLLVRRRVESRAAGPVVKTLQKIATVTRTATSGNNWVSISFTDDMKNCSELYLIFDITMNLSAQFNVLLNSTVAPGKLGQLPSATTFQTKMALSFTKAAEIGDYNFPIYANASVGNTQWTPAILDFLSFRPNSNTAQWQGTIEIWGWI